MTEASATSDGRRASGRDVFRARLRQLAAEQDNDVVKPRVAKFKGVPDHTLRRFRSSAPADAEPPSPLTPTADKEDPGVRSLPPQRATAAGRKRATRRDEEKQDLEADRPRFRCFPPDDWRGLPALALLDRDSDRDGAEPSASAPLPSFGAGVWFVCTHLDLSRCALDDGAVAALCRVLRRGDACPLRALDLRESRLDARKLTRLTRALLGDVRNRDAGDSSASDAAGAPTCVAPAALSPLSSPSLPAPPPPSITLLDLRSNRLEGDEASAALSALLAANLHALTALELADTDLTVDACRALTRAMRHNFALLRLSWGGVNNRHWVEGASLMVARLARNALLTLGFGLVKNVVQLICEYSHFDRYMDEFSAGDREYF